jgi:diguanylate cyclase (GGDEF)-like protein
MIDNIGDFLLKINIFSSLKKAEINLIINSFHKNNIKKDKILFKQGDEGNEMYIVKSGVVAISIDLPDGNKHEITNFSSGDFFGDMSIFEDAPRSATCYTKEDSCLLSLLREDFFDLLKKQPAIAIKIMYAMLKTTTQRLRDTGEFLSDMVRWGEDARKRAITDQLTGVYNRRFLDDALIDCFTASKNKNEPLCLIMVDLDHFRELNDQYGLKTGDKALLKVVDIFKKFLRKKDILARYGGDEFTVIMKNTTIERAKEIADSIRKDISELDMLDKLEGKIKHITTSQGIASFPKDADTLKDLRDKADKALYRAKEEGRNRVICAEKAE